MGVPILCTFEKFQGKKPEFKGLTNLPEYV